MRKFKSSNKTVKFVCSIFRFVVRADLGRRHKTGELEHLKVVVAYLLVFQKNTKYLFFVPLLLVNVLLESRHLALQLRHLQKQCIAHRTTGAKKLRKETKFRES